MINHFLSKNNNNKYKSVFLPFAIEFLSLSNIILFLNFSKEVMSLRALRQKMCPFSQNTPFFISRMNPGSVPHPNMQQPPPGMHPPRQEGPSSVVQEERHYQNISVYQQPPPQQQQQPPVQQQPSPYSMHPRYVYNSNKKVHMEII